MCGFFKLLQSKTEINIYIYFSDIYDRYAKGYTHRQMQSDWLHRLEPHRQF
jgi:hypothetical protein